MPPTAHTHDDRYYTETEVDTKLAGKQDKLVAGHFDYAGSIYGAKYHLLANAWESSLTVDPLEISGN